MVTALIQMLSKGIFFKSNLSKSMKNLGHMLNSWVFLVIPGEWVQSYAKKADEPRGGSNSNMS